MSEHKAQRRQEAAVAVVLDALEAAYKDTAPGSSGRIAAQNVLIQHGRKLPTVNY